MACRTGEACGLTETRSGASRWANHSAVISETIDALEAWWPPTLIPLRFGRTRLAWWTIAVPSHSTRRCTASRTSRSTSCAPERAATVLMVRASHVPAVLRPLPARDDETRLVGRHHGLRAVAQVELHQHAADVRLDRLLADHQPLGELAVGQPFGDEAQDLSLARGQLTQPIGARCQPRAQARELADQPPGDGGSQQRLPRRDDADRVEQALRRGVLEQEAAGARAERVIDVLVEIEGGEHQHPRPAAVRRDELAR